MCLTHRTRNKKKYKKKKKIYPEPIPDYSNICNEIYICGYCNNYYNSDDIKIYCDGCEKFFHCHVAGSCIGEKCTHTLASGMSHSSRYCLNCVNLNNPINKKMDGKNCICKNCENK
uniref:PHD-type domain-containing protein n=1 Tax=viral metagenome TaxID=1070528 RepID=A0A6C0CXG5_9ZZZZ